MTDRRILYLALAFVAALVIWHYRFDLAAICLCAVAFRVVAHQAGYRPRRSTLTQKAQAAGVLYAAWNSRWLKAKPGTRQKPTPGTVTLRSGVVLDQDDLEELFS